MVEDAAFNKKKYVTFFFREILNLERNPSRISGSKVTAILLNGWILPVGGVASGRVCACSLRSKLVYIHFQNKSFFQKPEWGPI